MNDEQAKAFYKSWAWKKCREIVLIRDNYLCQECIKLDRLTAANTVHHIIHLKDDPSKAMDIDNLTSVCPTCHERLHPNRGQKQKEETKRNIPVYEVEENEETY